MYCQFLNFGVGQVRANLRQIRPLVRCCVEIKQGIAVVGAFQGKQILEYFQRAERAGLPERKERSPLLELQARMIAGLQAAS